MNDLFGVPIRPKREVKPPAVHLSDAYGHSVCNRYGVEVTNDLNATTCLQCLARVEADRKRAAKIDVIAARATYLVNRPDIAAKLRELE